MVDIETGGRFLYGGLPGYSEGSVSRKRQSLPTMIATREMINRTVYKSGRGLRKAGCSVDWQ